MLAPWSFVCLVRLRQKPGWFVTCLTSYCLLFYTCQQPAGQVLYTGFAIRRKLWVLPSIQNTIGSANSPSGWAYRPIFSNIRRKRHSQARYPRKSLSLLRYVGCQHHSGMQADEKHGVFGQVEPQDHHRQHRRRPGTDAPGPRRHPVGRTDPKAAGPGSPSKDAGRPQVVPGVRMADLFRRAVWFLPHTQEQQFVNDAGTYSQLEAWVDAMPVVRSAQRLTWGNPGRWELEWGFSVSADKVEAVGLNPIPPAVRMTTGRVFEQYTTYPIHPETAPGRAQPAIPPRHRTCPQTEPDPRPVMLKEGHQLHLERRHPPGLLHPANSGGGEISPCGWISPDTEAVLDGGPAGPGGKILDGFMATQPGTPCTAPNKKRDRHPQRLPVSFLRLSAASAYPIHAGEHFRKTAHLAAAFRPAIRPKVMMSG